MIYKSRRNEILDSEGRQVAVVLPSACSKRDAALMAAFAAQQMNHEARKKERERLERERRSNA